MPARILVIEDNSDNLELMSYLLTAFGHIVLKAMDGVEGLQLARREKPDLILCDVQMRKLDGFEVVRQVRQDSELSYMRIVAVTAYAMSDVGRIRWLHFETHCPGRVRQPRRRVPIARRRNFLRTNSRNSPSR